MDPVFSNRPDDEVAGLAAAPELFVEGYRGAMVRAGMVKLNLFSTSLDSASRGVEKRAVARIVVPIADFLDMAEAMWALRTEILREPDAAGLQPTRGGDGS